MTSISQQDIQKYQTYGKICCWFTLLYNIGEGISSIVLGEEDSSISLIAFGVQSFIETASSILVLFRFAYMESYKPIQNGSEPSCLKTQEELKQKKFILMERIITIIIGIFFVILSVVIMIVSSLSLSHKNEPDSTIPNIIISAIGLVFTIIFWKIKKRVSQVLNSSAIAGDAACNLACLKLTVVMLIGSFIFTFWKGGWWVDSSIAIILSCFFLKEGIQVLKWGLAKNFTGGCSDCGPKKEESCCNKKPCSSSPTEVITCCNTKEQSGSTNQTCQTKQNCENKSNQCQNDAQITEKQTEAEQDLEQKKLNSNFCKNVDDNIIQDNLQQIGIKIQSCCENGNFNKQSINCQKSN